VVPVDLDAWQQKNERYYLDTLKSLVSMNSVYDNQTGIHTALDWCRDRIKSFLPRYQVDFDAGGNLICLPPAIDLARPALYLSAHIDTMPADAREWSAPFFPFSPYEDDREIVGRGVSDCKAGVAFELLISKLIGEAGGQSNIVLVVVSREEQGGESARFVGKELGTTLPLGSTTYLLNLENNLSLKSGTPRLGIHYSERGSFGLSVRATLPEIRDLLVRNSYPFNPTSIRPIGTHPAIGSEEVLEQIGGHAGVNDRAQNVLFQRLVGENLSNLLIEAGDQQSISTLPRQILIRRGGSEAVHEVILDLRTMDRFEQVKSTLDGLEYDLLKCLEGGYDISDIVQSDPIWAMMHSIAVDGLALDFGRNPGTTDCSTYYRHCPEIYKKRLIPLTIGPGCGSQPGAHPPRLSHGVNETFDKAAGRQAISYLLQLTGSLGVLGTQI